MNNSKLKETKKRGIQTLCCTFSYCGFSLSRVYALYALIPEGVPKAVIGSRSEQYS